MFTGIIERLGEVQIVENSDTNKEFTIKTDIIAEVYIDQSISHNGVCLTVVEIFEDSYRVTAIKETLEKTNLNCLAVGDQVNLERAMQGELRMDGHIVQGHVDDTAQCVEVQDEDGSWLYTFKIDPSQSMMLVDKGSVCVNGVSLTVVSPTEDTFQVAIIPYTYEHTTFKNLKPGSIVNIEWDIIGKYVVRYMEKLHGKTSLK